MTEGWYGDEHLILFDRDEIASSSERYSISQFLPGYQVVGLRGWDDFILQDPNGTTYAVPTVPATAEHLSPYVLPPVGTRLDQDDRWEGKIKWYVMPIVFGGDPNLGANITWVSHEQHAAIVKWWNEVYRSLKSGVTSPTDQ